MTALYPLLFEHNLHQTVWGGERIAKWKKLSAESVKDILPIGESWEVSAVESSPCVIANGFLAGKTLDEAVAEMPIEILGKSVARKYNNKMPLLAKFIDARNDLSIQVHPNDEMAQRVHGKMGKTEMWYVIDAPLGSTLYSGFKKHLSPEEYSKCIVDGTITDYLACHELRTGDVFYIPAGRIHAIGGGVLLAEIQQSSDVTYRVFDYNRPGLDGKPRELHTELAAQALDFTVIDNYMTEYSQIASHANRCIDSQFFSVRVVDLHSQTPFHRNLMKYDSFIITMCTRGKCKIRIRQTGDEITLSEGYSCLIPAEIADYDVTPITNKVQILDAFINNKNQNIFRKITRFLHITRK